MPKKIIALSAIAVTIAAAIGGGHYADNQLRQAYDTARLDKRINTVSDWQMGVFSGKNTWKSTITPDLCQPDSTYQLRGEDQISRGLTGYTIVSKVYVQPTDGKEFFLSDVTTKVSYSGNFDSEWTIPSNQYDLTAGMKMSWDAIKGSFSGHFNGTQAKAMNFAFEMPHIQFLNTSETDSKPLVSLKKLNYHGKADSDWRTKQNADFSIEELTWHGTNGAVSLHQLKSEYQWSPTPKTIHLKQNMNIQKVSVNQQYHFQDIQLNYDAHSPIGEEVLLQINQLLNESGERCITNTESNQQAEDLFYKIINAGITLSSENNQILSNTGKIEAQGKWTLKANSFKKEQDTNDLRNELMKNYWQSQYRVAMDKTILRELYDAFRSVMAPSDMPPSDDVEWEQSLSIFQAQIGAQDENNQLIIEK